MKFEKQGLKGLACRDFTLPSLLMRAFLLPVAKKQVFENDWMAERLLA
jgi:hypothetical protein